MLDPNEIMKGKIKELFETIRSLPVSPQERVLHLICSVATIIDSPVKDIPNDEYKLYVENFLAIVRDTLYKKRGIEG